MEFVGNKKTACFCGSSKCSGSIGEKPKEPEKKAKVVMKGKKKLKRKSSNTKVPQPEKQQRSIEDVKDPLLALFEEGNDPLICLLEKMPEKYNARRQEEQTKAEVEIIVKPDVVEELDIIKESTVADDAVTNDAAMDVVIDEVTKADVE
jgi:hypothetical protein